MEEQAVPAISSDVFDFFDNENQSSFVSERV